MIGQRGKARTSALLFTTWSPVVPKKYHDQPRRGYSISSVRPRPARQTAQTIDDRSMAHSSAGSGDSMLIHTNGLLAIEAEQRCELVRMADEIRESIAVKHGEKRPQRFLQSHP